MIKSLKFCAAPCAILFAMGLIACGAPTETNKKPQPPLTPKSNLEPWSEVLAFAGSGQVFAKNGILTLGQGEALSGVTFALSDHTAYPFPLVDYEITLKARRTRGSDIFCALTFPYKDLNTCATLIVGGWGGGLVGISSISELDASENETTAFVKFKNDQWYDIKLTVKDDYLMTHIDGAIVINYPLNKKPLSLRPGDIDSCAPLGLASFASNAEIKDMKITPLKKNP